MSIIYFSLLISILILKSKSQQQNGDKLWILLDDTSVFPCRGITNRFSINEKDVSIRNQQGRQVHYLEAPGTYVLSFHNIRVDETLPNLSGQVSGILQVPVVSVGQVLNWDYPYQLMPEKQVFGGYHCDKASGDVTDNGKLYCRYCDLCTTSDQVDQALNTREHKYLPNVGNTNEPEFDKICTQLDARSYTIQRTISLPNKQELEKQANTQFTGVGGELKKKLNKGKGKLEMELQVMTSSQPRANRDAVYGQSSKCRCCLPQLANDVSCRVNFLASGCDQDTCRGEYAKKCIQGNVQKVGCFTVQFNYQVTDNLDDVKAYLQKNRYQDEYNDLTGTSSSSSSSNSFHSSSSNSNSNGQQQPTSQTSNQGVQGGGQTTATPQQQNQCISKMAEDRFKRLCNVRWQQNFCCGMCGGC